MSDEHLLRRIMILGNELSECQQEAILHRDLAIKAQGKNVSFRELLREVEWSATMPHHIPSCPICGQSQEDGHASDCKMEEAVKNDS